MIVFCRLMDKTDQIFKSQFFPEQNQRFLNIQNAYLAKLCYICDKTEIYI